jgi:sulfur-oxidizing protein SoxX
MNKPTTLFTLLGLLLTLAGCNQGPTSGAGFRLPDGNPDVGREVFLYMQCNQCHTIEGTQLPVIDPSQPPYVELGGRVTKVKTYGELVTSIVNPSHKLAAGYAEDRVSEDGESNMYIYNNYMTVQELIELVAFLQEQYDVVPPQFEYRIYPH